MASEPSGGEGREIGERDFARADAPPEVGAVARDGLLARSARSDAERIPRGGHSLFERHDLRHCRTDSLRSGINILVRQMGISQCHSNVAVAEQS